MIVAIEKKIAVALAMLPSEDLLKWTKTEEQITCWLSNRFFNSYISACWSALHSGKDDPLQPLLKSGLIEKTLYNQVWLTTYFFESLWELVQVGFCHIRPALTELGIGKVPRSAYEMFTFAVWEVGEERFSVCLKPYHTVSAGKYIKQHKLLNKAENGKLTPNKQKELESWIKQDLQFSAISLILGISKKKATSSEKVLKAKLDDCLTAIDRLAACEVSQMRRSRSFAWKNGRILRTRKEGGTYIDA